jgi:hypothetical protein
VCGDRWLFFGDWGRSPKIVQSRLDGSHAEVILEANLSNPNGLAFHDGRLFLADSNYDNRTAGPRLKVYDVKKKLWQDLKLHANLTVSDYNWGA